MMKMFLKERVAWILFFVFTQLLLLLVSYLDASLSIASTAYIVFLTTLLFLIFLAVRYRKETLYYRELRDYDVLLGTSAAPEARSPMERIAAGKMLQQGELYNRQLNEMRVKMEREKDDALSWIHEVKTPLTTMQLKIDRVEDPKLRSELMYEWLRIHMLLDRQLHQKRLPFMRNDLFIEKVNLKTVLSQEIRELRHWCMQKGIGIEVNLPVTEVLTDAKWLGFIVRQMLTNAIKYSEKSEIMIISAMEEERVILAVEDSGRGIDAKDLPRIFDRGFTNTIEHHDQAATGMGLYLSKQVADTLLIDIRVTSLLGSGTRFELVFPKKNDMVQLAGM